MVGHNIIGFDIPILEEEIQRYESCREFQTYLDSIRVIDTYTIAKDPETWEILDMEEPTCKSLGYLHNYLLDKELVDSHSAMGDCLGNAQVLLKMDPTLKIAKKHMRKWNEVKKRVADDDKETEEE